MRAYPSISSVSGPTANAGDTPSRYPAAVEGLGFRV